MTRRAQVERRLAQLEARQPVGCLSCRRWDGTVLVHVDEEGQEHWRNRPDGCPRCGRVVPVRCQVEIVGPWGEG